MDIVKTVEQFANRRLARPSRSDQGYFFTRFERERHIAQDPVFVIVGKPHVFKDNLASNLCGLLRNVRAGDCGWGIEQLKDAFNRGQSRLQGGILGAELTDWHKKFLDVIHKRDQRP